MRLAYITANEVVAHVAVVFVELTRHSLRLFGARRGEEASIVLRTPCDDHDVDDFCGMLSPDRNDERERRSARNGARCALREANGWRGKRR
jgi:hypothetical protein